MTGTIATTTALARPSRTPATTAYPISLWMATALRCMTSGNTATAPTAAANAAANRSAAPCVHRTATAVTASGTATAQYQATRVTCTPWTRSLPALNSAPSVETPRSSASATWASAKRAPASAVAPRAAPAPAGVDWGVTTRTVAWPRKRWTPGRAAGGARIRDDVRLCRNRGTADGPRRDWARPAQRDTVTGNVARAAAPGATQLAYGDRRPRMAGRNPRDGIAGACSPRRGVFRGGVGWSRHHRIGHPDHSGRPGRCWRRLPRVGDSSPVKRAVAHARVPGTGRLRDGQVVGECLVVAECVRAMHHNGVFTRLQRLEHHEEPVHDRVL